MWGNLDSNPNSNYCLLLMQTQAAVVSPVTRPCHPRGRPGLKTLAPGFSSLEDSQLLQAFEIRVNGSENALNLSSSHSLALFFICVILCVVFYGVVCGVVCVGVCVCMHTHLWNTCFLKICSKLHTHVNWAELGSCFSTHTISQRNILLLEISSTERIWELVWNAVAVKWSNEYGIVISFQRYCPFFISFSQKLSYKIHQKVRGAFSSNHGDLWL